MDIKFRRIKELLKDEYDEALAKSRHLYSAPAPYDTRTVSQQLSDLQDRHSILLGAVGLILSKLAELEEKGQE